MESLENWQGSSKVGKPENYAGNLSIASIIVSMAFCGEDSFDNGCCKVSNQRKATGSKEIF